MHWTILVLLFLASFVAYVLRTNMSVAGEALEADLGLSQVQLGMVLAAFAWGYGIFQFPGGIFGQAQGARRALRTNLLLALGYNLVAVPIAVAGWLTPAIAALAMSGSSLLVVLNAARIGRQPKRSAGG